MLYPQKKNMNVFYDIHYDCFYFLFLNICGCLGSGLFCRLLDKGLGLLFFFCFCICAVEIALFLLLKSIFFPS